MSSQGGSGGAKQVHTKLKNTDRVQRALNEITGKQVPVHGSAAAMVVTYVTDLAHRVLEEASQLAKHRGETQVDAADVNLVLIKKYNIVMPPIDGVPRVTLHKETLPTSYTPFRYVAPTTAAAATKAEEDEGEDDDGDEGGAAAEGSGARRESVATGGKQKVSSATKEHAKLQPKKKKAKQSE